MGRKQVEINPECGKRLNQLLRNNMTQAELAEKLHYTPQQISRIIKGKSRLTEDVARQIIELFKTGDIEHDLFEVPSYEWLMCYDNDNMTVGEFQRKSFEQRCETENLIIQLIKLRGFKLQEIQVLCLEDDSGQKNEYPPEITPQKALEYEKKHGVVPSNVSYEEFISRQHGVRFTYKLKIKLTSPKGRIRYLEQADFSRLVNDVADFIDGKCAVQFRTSPYNPLGCLLDI